MAISKLDQLKHYTTVVADTGDFRLLRELKPQDCTTNPSLILRAVTTPDFEPLVDEVIGRTKALAGDLRVDAAAEWLAVKIGTEALKLIPGRISTEVDAALSFDTVKTVAAAHRLIGHYKDAGIDRERVLVKIAATREGIEACRILESEGINTNITLVFHLVQAVAAAKAGAWLISPFVGRILDWYQKSENRTYTPEEDPGVLSVRSIYHYFKQRDYKTVVMAASFRNQGEIEALAGCDRMTIAPALLSSLSADFDALEPRLSGTGTALIPELDTGESSFRWEMNESAMATEKLAEGIRLFNQDTMKLKAFIRQKLNVI